MNTSVLGIQGSRKPFRLPPGLVMGSGELKVTVSSWYFDILIFQPEAITPLLRTTQNHTLCSHPPTHSSSGRWEAKGKKLVCPSTDKDRYLYWLTVMIYFKHMTHSRPPPVSPLLLSDRDRKPVLTGLLTGLQMEHYPLPSIIV